MVFDYLRVLAGCISKNAWVYEEIVTRCQNAERVLVVGLHILVPNRVFVHILGSVYASYVLTRCL